MSLQIGHVPVRFLLTFVASLVGLVAATQAGDVVKMGTNYYRVTGATLAEVRESINRSRPWKNKEASDAQTDWTVRYKYTVEEAGDGSRVRSIETETIITITMPVWNPPPGTPKTLTDRWAQYFTSLLRHEYGHADHALRAAAEARKQAGAIKDAPTSRELTQKINDTVNRVLKEYREKDRDYDKRTRHGIEQGASFP